MPLRERTRFLFNTLPLTCYSINLVPMQAQELACLHSRKPCDTKNTHLSKTNNKQATIKQDVQYQDEQPRPEHVAHRGRLGVHLLQE